MAANLKTFYYSSSPCSLRKVRKLSSNADKKTAKIETFLDLCCEDPDLCCEDPDVLFLEQHLFSYI